MVITIKVSSHLVMILLRGFIVCSLLESAKKEEKGIGMKYMVYHQVKPRTYRFLPLFIFFLLFAV